MTTYLPTSPLFDLYGRGAGVGTVKTSLATLMRPFLTARTARSTNERPSRSRTRSSRVSRFRGPFGCAAKVGTDSASDSATTAAVTTFFEDMTPPIPSKGFFELEERSSPQGVMLEGFSLRGGDTHY